MKSLAERLDEKQRELAGLEAKIKQVEAQMKQAQVTMGNLVTVRLGVEGQILLLQEMHREETEPTKTIVPVSRIANAY